MPGAARASSSSAIRRSCGVVTLKFAGGASTTTTRPPARSTSQASSVAWASTSSPASSDAAQDLRPERLRRLDGPQAAAVVRAHDDAVVARLLDRVRDAGGGDGGVGAGQRGEGGAEERRVDERPRRVMDDDGRGVAGGRERAAHRLRAGRAALDERELERRSRPPAAPSGRPRRRRPSAPPGARAGRNRHDRTRQPRRGHGGERPGHHRPAGESDERLGPPQPKAFTAPRGDDDRRGVGGVRAGRQPAAPASLSRERIPSR